MNKSSVPQYCILSHLILQVARSSIAFYFVNISLVPVHSALSIQPGSMRTLISVWGPRESSIPSPDLTRHNQMRVGGRKGGKLYQTCPSVTGRWWLAQRASDCLSDLSVTEQSRGLICSVSRVQCSPVSVNITICLPSKPHPPSIIQTPQCAGRCSDKTPSLPFSRPAPSLCAI